MRMRIRVKQFLCLILVIMMVFSLFSACGTEEKEKNNDVKDDNDDMSYFNGVGFVPFYFPEGSDIDKVAESIGELGAVSVRLWMQFGFLLEAPDRINSGKEDYLHKVIAALRMNGVKQIVGMNHDGIFRTEKAILFRACRATRSVSEGKIIVMTGMAPIGVQRIGVYAENIAVEYDGMVQTLERIYSDIESGAFGSENPRDFFDKLSWHPYYAKQNERGEWAVLCPDEERVAVNQAVYAVAEKHGDGNVGVYFSEYGFNDGNNKDSDRVLAQYLVEGLRLTKAEMPFVESVQVYRLLNYMPGGDSWDDYSLLDCKTDKMYTEYAFVSK